MCVCVCVCVREKGEMMLLQKQQLVMCTSFLCEAVDLLLIATASQVESLHCDVIGNLTSCEESHTELNNSLKFPPVRT